MADRRRFTIVETPTLSLARFRPLLLAAALSATAPAAARADRILIQLPSMPAPAVYADGRRVETAITVFVRTNTVDDGSAICRNVPLIRDALLVEFSRRAIPALGAKKLDVAAAAPRLIEAINRGLRQPLVKALTFMPGVPTPPLTPAELIEGRRESNRRANDPNVCHRVVEIRDEIAPFVYAPDAPTVAQERPAARVEPFETHPQMRRQEAEVRPVVRAGADDPKEAPPKGAECDRDVAEYWKPGVYDVAGTRRALVRVFTVDRDRDGRTENVGFLFRAAGLPDVLMHYFDFPDRPSVKAMPALRLADERTIGRLCFGQASFESATDAPIPEAPPPPPPDAGKEFGVASVWIAIGLAALILILAGALIGFILARKRKAERRRRLERRLAGEERRKGGSSGYTGPERRAQPRRTETERREGKDRRGG